MIPELNKIYLGDCLEIMKRWPEGFIQTVVTSPPYWGLRDYGVQGQLGLEKTPDKYIHMMVAVFREVKRLLRENGTAWINLGDSYAYGGRGGNPKHSPGDKQASNRGSMKGREWETIPGLKPKDMVGIPWRLAFALQADGWYLRSDIIWAKPNPMPESVTDRPTKAHEYLFLLAKSERYFYDADAIKEPGLWDPNGFRKGYAYINQSGPQDNSHANKIPTGWDTGPGNHDKKRGRYKPLPEGQAKIRAVRDKQRGYPDRQHQGFNDRWDDMARQEQCSGMRNKRSVWTIATCPFPEAHFATYPPQLIKPCILAGSRHGDIVFDPFMGAGTTALVAAEMGRNYLGIELNPNYSEIAERRIANEQAQVKMAI